MKTDTVHDFFNWLINELLEGPLDWLGDVFIYPYSLFILGEIRIESCPRDTMDYLLSRRADAHAIGIEKAFAKILEIGDVRNGRFPVKVQYVFLDKTKARIATNTARYLCLLDERDRIRIESVDLTKISIPFRNSTILAT